MEFMVSVNFRAQDLAEITAHVPQERDRVKTLSEQGIIKTLYISDDRLHVWIVMQGDSQEQVQKDLASLPLYPYMEATITPLFKM